jgi:epoxide hydrolase-like predicted phosphatase
MTNITIKAVFWDIGGVLLRTEDPAPREKLAADLGVSRRELEILVFSGEQGQRAQRGELTPDELWAFVRQSLNLAPGDFPDLSERFFGGDVLDAELVGFIRTLRPRYRTGIISNAWSTLPKLLAQWGIADAFDAVIGSANVGIMKPDPRIYRLALERLGVQPAEAVFVDDFIENVRGAQRVGMHAIHFREREQALDELKSIAKM